MRRMTAVILALLMVNPAMAAAVDYPTCSRATEGPFDSDLLNDCTTYLETALERYRWILQGPANAQDLEAYDQHLDLALQLAHWFARNHEPARPE